MIELMLVALLLWLWVIERRLNTLGQSVRGLRLDLEGLRSARQAPPERPVQSEPAPDAGEVLPFERSEANARRHEPRVH
jgi:hypothetical protein